jgi:predicted GNAT superfamily acetyltransferase
VLKLSALAIPQTEANTTVKLNTVESLLVPLDSCANIVLPFSLYVDCDVNQFVYIKRHCVVVEARPPLGCGGLKVPV